MLSILFVACEHQPVFYAYQPAPDKGWSCNDTLVFTPEIADSNRTFHVCAEIRCLSSYAYEHLGLKYNYTPEHGELILQDTVSVKLRDLDGTWEKNGLAGLRSFSFPLKPLRINEAGKYNIKIVQNQSDSLMYGIFDVGLKILPVNTDFN